MTRARKDLVEARVATNQLRANLQLVLPGAAFSTSAADVTGPDHSHFLDLYGPD